MVTREEFMGTQKGTVATVWAVPFWELKRKEGH
jgi:hypothetical protein